MASYLVAILASYLITIVFYLVRKEKAIVIRFAGMKLVVKLTFV